MPPNDPNPAAMDAPLWLDPQIPACAFSFSISLIDFAGPDDGVAGFADAELPSPMDHRSSKFALAACFGAGDVVVVRAG